MHILKILRRKKKISQTELADAIGVSLRTIQLYEKKDANIPIKNLSKIAEYFGMSIAELYIHEINEEGDFYSKRKVFSNHGNICYPLDYGKYLVMAPVLLFEQQKEYLAKRTQKDFLSALVQVGFILDYLEGGFHMAFEIIGDAMEDKTINAIPNGALVLGLNIDKKVFVKRADEFKGEVVLLVCAGKIICKSFTGLNEDMTAINCHSLNPSPEYQDFAMPIADVHELFVVVKKQI